MLPGRSHGWPVSLGDFSFPTLPAETGALFSEEPPVRDAERIELMKQAEARARDLERALLKAFERDLRWVTVTLGSKAGVDEKGREVFSYSFGINLYDELIGRPAAHVDVDVFATNEEISEVISKAISRFSGIGARE